MTNVHDILTPAVLSDLLVDVPEVPTAADVVRFAAGGNAADEAFATAVIDRERAYARTCVAVARRRDNGVSLSNVVKDMAEVAPLFGWSSWNATSVRRAHLIGLVVDDRPVPVADVKTLLGTNNPSEAIKVVAAAEAGEAFVALQRWVNEQAKPAADETDGEGADGEGADEGADEAESTTTDADIAVAIANALKGWSNDGTADPASFVAAVAAAVGVTAAAAVCYDDDYAA